ncbi:DUF2971 domain-containing protein [Pedobacter fastidiosus]|uniref:DUF2971 domain-containing protein n=1 Tax=Pedobacter fastidiosus TaxID=2765361 RepID=A0ABR7KPB2_9SPHI|nr:DUF2971 domain-containing protein [Pedobacter fastidiosus]MBC6109915.1 DUF2971 domain-containing protein [Pedobacter fastidiosus]
MSAVKLIDELKLPPSLYKYRYYYQDSIQKKVSAAVSSLYSMELYIPSADTFNDPYDSAIPFRYNPNDLTEENIYKKCLQLAGQQFPNESAEFLQNYAYKNHRKGLLNNPDHIEQFDIDTFKRSCKDFGIFCLTEDPVNTLMWSYYADSHYGICIGYDTEKLISSKIFGMGGKVIYRDNFPLIPLFPDENHHHFLNLFYTKWNVWSHENEYRLLHTYKNGKVHKIDSEFITEVILGCKFREEDKLPFAEKLIKIYPHILVSEIKMNKEKFELEKKEVINGKSTLF